MSGEPCRGVPTVVTLRALPVAEEEEGHLAPVTERNSGGRLHHLPDPVQGGRSLARTKDPLRRGDRSASSPANGGPAPSRSRLLLARRPRMKPSEPAARRKDQRSINRAGRPASPVHLTPLPRLCSSGVRVLIAVLLSFSLQPPWEEAPGCTTFAYRGGPLFFFPAPRPERTANRWFQARTRSALTRDGRDARDRGMPPRGGPDKTL